MNKPLVLLSLVSRLFPSVSVMPEAISKWLASVGRALKRENAEPVITGVFDGEDSTILVRARKNVKGAIKGRLNRAAVT